MVSVPPPAPHWDERVRMAQWWSDHLDRIARQTGAGRLIDGARCSTALSRSLLGARQPRLWSSAALVPSRAVHTILVSDMLVAPK